MANDVESGFIRWFMRVMTLTVYWGLSWVLFGETTHCGLGLGCRILVCTYIYMCTIIICQYTHTYGCALALTCGRRSMQP